MLELKRETQITVSVEHWSYLSCLASCASIEHTSSASAQKHRGFQNQVWHLLPLFWRALQNHRGKMNVLQGTWKSQEGTWAMCVASRNKETWQEACAIVVAGQGYRWCKDRGNQGSVCLLLQHERWLECNHSWLLKPFKWLFLPHLSVFLDYTSLDFRSVLSRRLMKKCSSEAEGTAFTNMCFL